MSEMSAVVSVPAKRYEDLIAKEKLLEQMLSGKAPCVKVGGREEKIRFGKYGNVLLTQREYDRLCMEYPYEAQDAVRYLDEYIEMKGYKAKSHNLAIRKWVFDALKERKIARAKIRKGEQMYVVDTDAGRLNFDMEDIFERPRVMVETKKD